MRSLVERLVSLHDHRSVRDFFVVNAAGIVLQPVVLIRGFIVATYLGPATYGVYKSLELISLLNKYGNIGFRSVAVREVGASIGSGDHDAGELARDVAYSAELVIAAVLTLVGLMVAAFSPSAPIGVAIALATLGLLANKLLGIVQTEATIRRAFVMASRVTVVAGIAGALLVWLTVPSGGIYAALSVPIVIAMFSASVYVRQLSFRFSFRTPPEELRRQLRIGLPLAATGMSLGSFKYAERLLLLTRLGSGAVGLFALANTLLDQATTLFVNAIKVRKMHLFEWIGSGDHARVHRAVVRETSLLVAGAAVIGALIGFAAGPLIRTLLPDYVDTVPVFRALLVALPFRVLMSYTNIVVISPAVNKQAWLPFIHLAGTILLIGGSIVLEARGSLNVLTFAWLDVAAQISVSLLFVSLYFAAFYRPLVAPR